MKALWIRTRYRARGAGFTLVELMISLLMGVIIALAVVGLARTATATFHEQARLSSTEMTIRTASERLRNDLLRISYMSTANIKLDPKIAKKPGGANARIGDLTDLQGVRFDIGAGKTRTEGASGYTLATKHGLNPDDIYISGNLTGDDVYRGQWVDTGSCGGGGVELRLSALADPAVGRLFNGATAEADVLRNVNAVFMPGQNMTPPDTDAVHAVQVMDMRGCFHYLEICKVVFTDKNTILIDLKGDGTSGILTPEETGGDVCGGRLMEEFAIAPIQRVRWYLDSSADTRLYDPSLEGTGGDKFNLYRQLLQADGAKTVGPPELVAEYAIDMKFGIVVDDKSKAVPDNIVAFDFDAKDDIAKWTGKASDTVADKEGPQRIRSIRYRLAFRTGISDRQSNLALPAGPPYLARYCTGNGTLAACKQFARVRTIISEVALMNQARSFY